MKTLLKHLLLLTLIIASFIACKKNGTIDDENMDYTFKITNPLDGYTVEIGSKVLLTVQYEGFTLDNTKFYLDNTEVSTNFSSDAENFIDSDNKAYVWQVSGISSGNHTLKAEAYSDNEKVATKEITLNFIQPKWHLIDLSPYVGTDYNVNEVFLLNETTGWINVVANNSHYLLKTSDKGLTWQVITNNSDYWEKFAFSDNNNGVAIENYSDKLYKLTNQGQNKTAFNVPPFSYGNVKNLSFTQNPNEITVVAKRYSDDFECVYRINTSDFSIIQTTPVTDNDSTSGAFFINFKNSKGIITDMVNVNGNQYVYITDDNGLNWQYKELQPVTNWNGYEIENADIFDDNNIWLVGGDTSDYLDALVYTTSDGGNNWNAKEIEQKLSFPTGSFIDIALLSPTEAYAISSLYSDGNDIVPKMYHTTDGGNNWQPVYNVSKTGVMHKIEMKGNNFGIAIGDENKIYRYSNN